MKFEKLKNWAKGTIRTIELLKLAYKDPRVPRVAKIFSGIIIAYALSPIDLIPDFIPIIGYLDDLIIVPIGISLALKMIPKDILNEYKKKLEEK
ncbi:MAG: YkvA family protein [Minisyncoccales bacterium]